ncbi:MAG TPA: RecX family transcriptional regulator [Solirubrobacteraceae bacterium]|nr:RecX family transcriptional regulator [Solirubrobacteraceae bacterium]
MPPPGPDDDPFVAADIRRPPPGPDEDPFGGADAEADDRRAPPPERSPDPEVRLQHARDVAWHALNRREHTVADLARTLAKRRVEPAVIDAIVGELCEQGYLDDARFAHRFADDRRRLDGWGAERIERRLRALGVAPDLIEAAVGEQGHEQEMDAALALLQRRFPDPPATPRDCERALGVLVRKGYGLELAHDAIRRHAGVTAFD